MSDRPEPYYRDDSVTIYHGDCRDILDALTFDVIVTDPPYGIEQTALPESLGATQHDPIIGDDSTDLAEWILRYPSPSVVFGAHEFPHLLSPPGRLYVWDKRLTRAADRMLGSPFEMAYANRAGPNRMLRCLHGGVVNANSVTAGVRAARRLHPTEKPVPMLREMLSTVGGAIVCDPFAGSGTTLRAAKDLGRRAIGIEIEERYCEIAARRCAQEVLSLGDLEADR